MTQAELESEVARTTGESLCTIRQRGFSLIDLHDREPQIVDWDELDAQRTAYFPQRGRTHRLAVSGGIR